MGTMDINVYNSGRLWMDDIMPFSTPTLNQGALARATRKQFV